MLYFPFYLLLTAFYADMCHFFMFYVKRSDPGFWLGTALYLVIIIEHDSFSHRRLKFGP